MLFARARYWTMVAAAMGAVALGGMASPAGAVPVSSNLLTNGSFENGLTGWTIGGGDAQGYPPVSINYHSNSGYPNGAYGEKVTPNDAATNSPDAVGTHAAYFVSDYATAQSLSQSLYLAAGTYQVGFSLYLPQNGYDNAGDADFSAEIAGLTLLNITASSLQPAQWTSYAMTISVATAGTYSFDFAFTTDQFPSKDVIIDQAYVIAGNPPVNGGTLDTVPVPAPEPASLAVLGTGLLGLALLARRRKNHG